MMNRNSKEYKNLPQVSKDFLWHVEWHRKLWDWMFRQKSAWVSKSEYPHEIINGLKINNIECNCFCCEYAYGEFINNNGSKYLQTNCDQCFLYWPKIKYKKYEKDELSSINLIKDYDCEMSIYGNWDNKKINNKDLSDLEIKNLAKQIRDLPLEYDFIKGFLGKERSS